MEITEKLTLREAKYLFIRSQFNGDKNPAIDKSHLYKIIDQLGYVQIDTISVVERSHHHVLWTRMPDYKKIMLDELVHDKKVFEYWSHAAAYLPMKDYRYSLIRKENYLKNYKTWGKANRKIISYVYNRIKNEGPLQSKDFDDKRDSASGWWDWKPSKDALDFLFHQGKLMIAKRSGFQKVYDLAERILPANIDSSCPTEKEYYKHIIENSIKANGLVTEKEITYQRKYNRIVFGKLIKELLEDKKILKVQLKGIVGEYYFTTQDKLELLNEKKNYSGIHILSPFDNLVIQRKKLKTFFGFDYTIECYLPESKRKFGYFCMPVLNDEKIVGRIDAKADRAGKIFFVKKIYWEDNVNLNDRLIKKLERKLKEFGKFTGCEKIEGYSEKSVFYKS